MVKKIKKNTVSIKNLFIIATCCTIALVLPLIFSYSTSTDSKSHEAYAITTLSDNFNAFPSGIWQEGSTHSSWRVVFHGLGEVGIQTDGTQVLYEKPKASTQTSETHAGLVVSNEVFSDMTLIARAKTIQQLRTPTPNAWETAWVMWHYTDNTHFYYLALKTNGWELGKGDPAYPGAQRFLATGSTPSFPLGSWSTVKVTQQGNTMNVWVNGTLLTTFTDTETPYTSGSIGLYNEDAHVAFDDITVSTQDSLPSATITSAVPAAPTFSCLGGCPTPTISIVDLPTNAPLPTESNPQPKEPTTPGPDKQPEGLLQIILQLILALIQAIFGRSY